MSASRPVSAALLAASFALLACTSGESADPVIRPTLEAGFRQGVLSSFEQLTGEAATTGKMVEELLATCAGGSPSREVDAQARFEETYTLPSSSVFVDVWALANGTQSDHAVSTERVLDSLVAAGCRDEVVSEWVGRVVGIVKPGAECDWIETREERGYDSMTIEGLELSLAMSVELTCRYQGAEHSQRYWVDLHAVDVGSTVLVLAFAQSGGLVPGQDVIAGEVRAHLATEGR